MILKKYIYYNGSCFSNLNNRMFHSSVILNSDNNNINNSELNNNNDSDSDYIEFNNRLDKLKNLKPGESSGVGDVGDKFVGPRVEYNFGTIDDSFEGVNKDDPFFGLVRKILQACVNKENIPLEKILVDNGLYKGIWVLLHNYPIITIFGIKKYPLLEEAEDSKEENNDIIRLNKEVEELKVKVENISEKANSIDELKSILVNVLDKLKDLSSSSMAIFSEIDYVETSIYAAGYVAPILTYKKLLSQYLKLTEINYKPQNAGEVRILHSMKRESIIRFNRVGIPLMALTYLAIWNSSNFKNIFKGFHLDGAFTPVEGTDHILESEITNNNWI